LISRGSRWSPKNEAPCHIEGQTHYGYVGFEGVEVDDANDGPEGRVFGLGYETVPGMAIAAGAGLPAGLEADVDADGDVDGNDFLIIQRGLGGTYDAGDLEAFKAEFGQTSAAGAAAGVPEPNSLSLLAAGAAGLTFYLRRPAERSAVPKWQTRR